MSNLGNKPGAQSGATIQRQTHRTKASAAVKPIITSPQLAKPVETKAKGKGKKSK